MKATVRLFGSAVLLSPLPAVSQEEQQSKQFLPYIIKCPAANGGVFQGHFMNKLGQRVVVSVIYKGEDRPGTMETATAERGKKMEPKYSVNPDKPKNANLLTAYKNSLKRTDPLYQGLCLERGEEEPFRTRVLLDSNKIELLGNGLNIEDEDYKPFQ